MWNHVGAHLLKLSLPFKNKTKLEKKNIQKRVDEIAVGTLQLFNSVTKLKSLKGSSEGTPLINWLTCYTSACCSPVLVCTQKTRKKSQKLVPAKQKNRPFAKLNARKNLVLHGIWSFAVSGTTHLEFLTIERFSIPQRDFVTPTTDLIWQQLKHIVYRKLHWRNRFQMYPCLLFNVYFNFHIQMHSPQDKIRLKGKLIT